MKMQNVSGRIFLLMVPAFLTAWYPDVSLLTPGLQPDPRLLQTPRMTGPGLLALGESFEYFLPEEPASSFRDPARLLDQQKPRSLYLDIGGNRLFQLPAGDGDVIPLDEPYLDDRSSLWIPTPEYTHEETGDPLLQGLWSRRSTTGNQAIGLGGGLQYDEDQFYAPFRYWPVYAEDALGNAYENENSTGELTQMADGRDRSTLSGFSGHFLYARRLSPHLDLGALLSGTRETVKGRLDRYQYRDTSPWATDMLLYQDSEEHRDRTFQSRAVQVSLAWRPADGKRLAFSLGAGTNRFDHEHSLQDSSLSRYAYIVSTADTSRSTYQGSHASREKLIYDGSREFVQVEFDHPYSPTLTLRGTVLASRFRSDLAGLEDLSHHSAVSSSNPAADGTTIYEYANTSYATAQRDVQGSYGQDLIRAVAGLESVGTAGLHFLGGLDLMYSWRDWRSEEPFTGYKSSRTERSGYPSQALEELQTRRDVRSYTWRQTQNRLRVAIPLGFRWELDPRLEIRGGLTRVFDRRDQREGYTIQVDTLDNHTQRDSESEEDLRTDYAERYDSPAQFRVDNRFELNGGAILRTGEHLRMELAFSRAYLDAYRLRLALKLVW